MTRNHPPIEGQDPTDHATFHPGLWLAFGDLGGADDWRNRARVEHERFVAEPHGGAGRGTFTVRNRYLAAQGDADVCEEVCRYTILVRPAGYLLISDSEFTSDRRRLRLRRPGGDGVRRAGRHAAGGRAAGAGSSTATAARTSARCRGKPADWCDYSGTIAGQRAGVTLMPDPRNFRRSWFHARDYGLLVANPFGRKALTGGDRRAASSSSGANRSAWASASSSTPPPPRQAIDPGGRLPRLPQAHRVKQHAGDQPLKHIEKGLKISVGWGSWFV